MMILKARDGARIRAALRRAVAFGPVWTETGRAIRSGGAWPVHPSSYLQHHRRGPVAGAFRTKLQLLKEKL